MPTKAPKRRASDRAEAGNLEPSDEEVQRAQKAHVADGALFGNPAQLGIQALAVSAAIVYSGAMTFVLLKLISVVLPLRATAEDEITGLDLSLHGEEAYMHADSGGRGPTSTLSTAGEARIPSPVLAVSHPEVR